MPAAISQDDYLNDTSQFDLARKRAAEASAVNLQSRRDALARRFAALGNLDSGARIKQEQVAQDEENSNLTKANEGINAQQQSELGRRKEVIQGQQFQSGEAEKGRKFSAGEAALQRAYGTSERLGSQGFASGERAGSQDFASQQAALQRAYGTSERLAGQGFATGEREAGQGYASSEAQKQRELQEKQFEQTYGLSAKQFEESINQFKQTFAEEYRVNTANMDFAQQALNKKGILESLTGGVGDVGKGIGGLFGKANSWLNNNAQSPFSGISSTFSSVF